MEDGAGRRTKLCVQSRTKVGGCSEAATKLNGRTRAYVVWEMTERRHARHDLACKAGLLSRQPGGLFLVLNVRSLLR
eukprot:2958488-Rhodomonas_salina.2